MALPISSLLVPLPQIHRSIVKFEGASLFEMIAAKVFFLGGDRIHCEVERPNHRLSFPCFLVRVIWYVVYFVGVTVYVSEVVGGLPSSVASLRSSPRTVLRAKLFADNIASNKCLRLDHDLIFYEFPSFHHNMMVDTLDGSIGTLGAAATVAPSPSFLPYATSLSTCSI